MVSRGKKNRDRFRGTTYARIFCTVRPEKKDKYTGAELLLVEVESIIQAITAHQRLISLP